jgi:hypothetical protein
MTSSDHCFIGGFKIVPANREMEFDTAIFKESSSTKKVVFVQAAENFDLLFKKIEILDLSSDTMDCKPFLLKGRSLLQPFSYCCDNANFKVCLLKVNCSNLLQGK